MENKIASWEAEIAKKLNLLRKELAGKGAKKSEVRICDNVIFSKMTIDLSDQEVGLFQQIQTSPSVESGYYDSLKPKYIICFKRFMEFIHPMIETNDLHIKVDVDAKSIFIIFILNMDLESMIRKGTVSLPIKAG